MRTEEEMIDPFTENTMGWYDAYVRGEKVPTAYERLFRQSQSFEVLDRVRGCLYGCAVGDALGYPVEFMHVRGGSNVVKGFSSSLAYLSDVGAALYTDDTQMTLRTAMGLLHARTFDDIHTAGECVAEQYITWMNEDPPRAPGNTCLFGCRRLEAIGVNHWRVCGKPEGGGCGTVMRSGPYGLWHNTDPQLAGLWAGEHSYMTHGHTMASSAAAALAAGVAYLFHDDDQFELVETMVEAAEWFDGNTACMLTEAFAYANDLADPADVLDKFLGWRGDEAIAASLYCLLMKWNSFDEAVLLAANSPGDSDSLGAITGALAGTMHGFKAIDPEWTSCIEDADFLESVSQALSNAVW